MCSKVSKCMSPLLQQVLGHLNALRGAGDGDDAVGGAGQRLGDLDSRAALRADLADAGSRLTDYRARQLENKVKYAKLLFSR